MNVNIHTLHLECFSLFNTSQSHYIKGLNVMAWFQRKELLKTLHITLRRVHVFDKEEQEKEISFW